MKIDARWTDDCCGKKDYDGEILSISTRYWPAGGGFLEINRGPDGVSVHGPGHRPDIKPRAHSSILLRYRVDDEGERCVEDLTLVEAEFEADTEDEVKRQVEVWAQEQMDRAVHCLQAEFGK